MRFRKQTKDAKQDNGKAIPHTLAEGAFVVPGKNISDKGKTHVFGPLRSWPSCFEQLVDSWKIDDGDSTRNDERIALPSVQNPSCVGELLKIGCGCTLFC